MFSLTATWHSKRFGNVLSVSVLMLSTASAVAVYAVDRSHKPDLVVREASTSTTMHLGTLRTTPLYNLRTHSTEVIPAFRSPKRFSLIIFLSAADCSACMSQIPLWNSLTELRRDDFNASLVFVDSTLPEVQTALKYYTTNYDVFVDQDGALARKMGMPPKTPVSVLIDDKDTVRVAEGATNDFESQQAFVSTVRAIVTQTQQKD